MSDDPIYASPSTARSVWQEYLIYDDRVVFKTHFGDIAVPFDEVEKIELSESEVRGLMRGDLHLSGFRPALKVDWANFAEHVVLDRSGGRVHRILFTPQDPLEFKEMLEEAVRRYRDRKGGSPD